MLTIPTLDLYRDSSTGDYAIVNYAVDATRGLCTAFGEVVRIDANTFAHNGIAVIVDQLRNFHARTPVGKAEMEERTANQSLAFETTHDHVGILYDEKQSQLKLCPMRRHRNGGYVGQQDDQIRAGFPIANESFIELLNEAFERCV